MRRWSPCSTSTAFYAIDDVCTHDGGELAGGAVEGDVVICPRHGARFCLRTGAALTPPAYEPVRTYPTRVVDGVVEVDGAASYIPQLLRLTLVRHAKTEPAHSDRRTGTALLEPRGQRDAPEMGRTTQSADT